MGLLVVLVIAKQFTFAVSQASGFVGGPIFPALFIGGTVGVLVHEVVPGVPLGLAFTCLLAAVPGSLAAAPFSMVLLAAFLTQVGALQTAPILIAVVTAFLTMEAVKYLVARRKQARAAAGKPSVGHRRQPGEGRGPALSGGPHLWLAPPRAQLAECVPVEPRPRRAGQHEQPSRCARAAGSRSGAASRPACAT